MRLRLAVALLVSSVLAIPTIAQATAPFERWVSARGVLLVGLSKARAENVLRSVHPCLETTPLRIHVLDSPDVGAFAWPEGDIVVTAALLDLLSDDELAAAIAHEVGHLLSDGHLRSAAALVGKPSQHDAEAAADELGMRLLTDGGRSASAMARMIRKVQAARGSNDSAFQALGYRLELLERKQ